MATRPRSGRVGFNYRARDVFCVTAAAARRFRPQLTARTIARVTKVGVVKRKLAREVRPDCNVLFTLAKIILNANPRKKVVVFGWIENPTTGVCTLTSSLPVPGSVLVNGPITGETHIRKYTRRRVVLPRTTYLGMRHKMDESAATIDNVRLLGVNI